MSSSRSLLLRILVLALAVVVLVFDAFWYYGKPAFGDQPQDLVRPTSVESPSPTKVPMGQVKPSELNFESRIVVFTKVRTLDQNQINAAQESFLKSVSPTPVSAVAEYLLRYEIKGRDGSWQPVTAQVYIPETTGNFPLYVFGSGTTGIADKCAPSLENMSIENLGNYANHMIAQAALGYVTVFPDYEGFHNAQVPQAYFISESEAKTLIGAIKSLLQLKPDTPALEMANLESVFVGGYSQGGHAALSAAQHWSALPKSVQLKGIVQFAGAADVQALFRESPHLASYLVESFISYYPEAHLQMSDVLKEPWLTDMTANNQKLCVNAAYSFYPREMTAVYTPAFSDALASQTWPASLKAWDEVSRLNSPFDNLPNVPYLSIQGASDPIVEAVTQRANYQKLCQQKLAVVYKEYPGVDHFQVRQNGFNYSNSWMKDVLAGQNPETTCPQP